MSQGYNNIDYGTQMLINADHDIRANNLRREINAVAQERDEYRTLMRSWRSVADQLAERLGMSQEEVDAMCEAQLDQ